MQATAGDRFSNLPGEVAHHILSFLTFKELGPLGCVSKRCREFSLSVPSLNFDHESCWKGLSYCKRLMVFNSFDRFLINRGDNKIVHFRIRFEIKNGSKFDEVFRIFNWIHTAVRRNLEVLELDLQLLTDWVNQIELPSRLLSCTSLRSLVVNFSNNEVIWPSSLDCFPNLQRLKMRNIKILRGELFCKWISCSCKFFKELWLENIYGIECITLESSSLESFSFLQEMVTSDYDYGLCHVKISGEKLEDMHIEWGLGSLPCSRSLNIFAPNLKNFKWSGILISDQNLVVKCLEKAEIFLNPTVDDFTNIFEVLCSVSSVKVLILNKETTKALFRLDLLLQDLPLNNICYLGMLVESLSDDLIPGMVSYLRGMTTLSTLCLKSDPSSSFNPMEDANISSGFDMGYWKSQNLQFIYHLKEVTIELSNGSNELELARYILENAQNLKFMVILYSEGPQKSNVVEMVWKSKTISTATILLQGKPNSCPRKKLKRKKV